MPLRSEKQRAASRRNGALSRGPLSPRQPSHSQAVVLNTESSQRFSALLAELFDHFQPATPAEASAVEHFAAAEWRLRRLWSSESSLLDLQIDDDRPRLDTDSPTRTALALQQLNHLDRFSLYETRLVRNKDRALHQLQQLRKLRAEPTNSLILHEAEPTPNPSATQLLTPHPKELLT